MDAAPTRPTLAFDVPTDPPTAVGNTDVYGLEQKEVLSVNDNGGRGGFEFQDTMLHGKAAAGAYIVQIKDWNPTYAVQPAGVSRRVGLLSRRRTDVLLVDVKAWPQGVFADPQRVEGRAAWYSFAFFLRTAAAVDLNVDTNELDAGVRTTERVGVPIAQAFLSDKLENGAGYCQWLARRENFEGLLAHADSSHWRHVSTKWLEPSHAGTAAGGDKCDTSCNRCLRDFNNLPYHGLLDWRLAIDLARIARDPHAVVDLTTDWDGRPNPWKPLLEGANAPLPALLNRLLYDRADFGGLTAYTHRNQPLIWILCHPLWSDQHPAFIAAKVAALAAHGNVPATNIRMMNPFIALRRVAAYVAAL